MFFNPSEAVPKGSFVLSAESRIRSAFSQPLELGEHLVVIRQVQQDVVHLDRFPEHHNCDSRRLCKDFFLISNQVVFFNAMVKE